MRVYDHENDKFTRFLIFHPDPHHLFFIFHHQKYIQFNTPITDWSLVFMGDDPMGQEISLNSYFNDDMG